MQVPSEDAIRWLVATYASLRAGHAEAFEESELVTPTSKHFPDPFEKDMPSVERLLARVLSYTPLSDDLDVALAFVEAEAQEGSSCSSGACSSPTGARIDGVAETETGYRLLVNINDTGHPVTLTTAMVRGVGALVLAEGEVEIAPEDIGATSEVAAAACGLGVLLANGAHLYTKSCGGARVHRATALSVEESALMLALFCAVHDKKPSVARKHLTPTPIEAFDECWAWVQSNPKLVRDLRDAPERLVDGIFQTEATKGLLGRLFTSKEDDIPEPVVAAPKRSRSPEEERRLAEARALVDEAFGSDQ